MYLLNLMPALWVLQFVNKMKILTTTFAFVMITCLSGSLLAQTQIDKQKDKDITSMHEFLKANMDSTISIRSILIGFILQNIL